MPEIQLGEERRNEWYRMSRRKKRKEWGRAERVRKRHGKRKMTGNKCWEMRGKREEEGRRGWRQKRRKGKEKKLTAKERKQTAEEEAGKWNGRQTEETRSDGEAGGVERQLKMERRMVSGGRGGNNKEGRVEGKSSYFNIKQHREEFNVPFTDPFACL